MAPDRMNASWLRAVVALIALTGLLALSGCGGGSGAPNNPFASKPPAVTPIILLPAAITVYSHTPATVSVSGGVPPYQAFSSNTALLPVAQAVNGATIVLLANDAAAATAVVITVQDSIGQTATATATVNPAPIFGTLTITPANQTCAGGGSSGGGGSGSTGTTTNVVCSGQTATASVQVKAPSGAGLPNRQVRFDVVSGAFAFQSSNPAQPLVASLTVVSDANGNANAILQANAGVPTQPAQLRVTEVTTGNSVIGNFTILQSTNGSAVLSVVPATATLTGADSASCSGNFRVDYFIYGGTPPYHVSSSFPSAVTIVNPIVPVSGGAFEAVTNGTCVNPLTFTIVDATGLQTTATLINQPGTVTPPAPPGPAVAVTPGSVSTTTVACESAAGISFVISGGTPPFSVAASGATVSPSPVTTSPGTFSVKFNPPSAVGSPHTIFIGDAGKPQQTTTATVTCS